ncbi:ADP-ribosylglycohydrolase family protein [Laceyella sacchari]|uniref:ADP-ribosylglycohydrolase family protein n=1 Tax=Laceyella sacchari TaxID=37482 RepID=A0ABY5U5Q0_LACSH|nr:ADP-ribosylglycohydrolase family protein [Laceyella sacchari]UWE04972.1 ADP-ribosylglycohydrolase family protein [Laceyella sacchari]
MGRCTGMPCRGMAQWEIEEVYGQYSELPTAYPVDKIAEKKRRRLRPHGLHSDDTQQAMALVQFCLAAGGWNRDAWKSILVQGMKQGAWRGVGRFFTEALHRMRKGERGEHAGSPSAGMGAAMRIGPLGALYCQPEQADLLWQVALESSLATHRDARAAGFAALPELARQGEERLQEMSKQGWRIDEVNSSAIREAMVQACTWIDMPVEAMRRRLSDWARPQLKEGFTRAHPNQGFVLLGGLHALLMSCRDDLEPTEVLLSIIREGFDTDTVAAIAGAVLGARVGDAWIPKEKFYDQMRIEAYADALVTQVRPETPASFLKQEAELTDFEKTFSCRK